MQLRDMVNYTTPSALAVTFVVAAYDIIVFSYVISPLNENLGFSKLVDGLLNTNDLAVDNFLAASPNAKIVG